MIFEVIEGGMVFCRDSVSFRLDLTSSLAELKRFCLEYWSGLGLAFLMGERVRVHYRQVGVIVEDSLISKGCFVWAGVSSIDFAVF
jgi:hypothetical protein